MIFMKPHSTRAGCFFLTLHSRRVFCALTTGSCVLGRRTTLSGEGHPSQPEECWNQLTYSLHTVIYCSRVQRMSAAWVTQSPSLCLSSCSARRSCRLESSGSAQQITRPSLYSYPRSLCNSSMLLRLTFKHGSPVLPHLNHALPSHRRMQTRGMSQSNMKGCYSNFP